MKFILEHWTLLIGAVIAAVILTWLAKVRTEQRKLDVQIDEILDEASEAKVTVFDLDCLETRLLLLRINTFLRPIKIHRALEVIRSVRKKLEKR